MSSAAMDSFRETKHLKVGECAIDPDVEIAAQILMFMHSGARFPSSTVTPTPTSTATPTAINAEKKEKNKLIIRIPLKPKKQDHQELSPPTTSPDYKCSVCGKAFASFQALGGHKTMHRTKTSPVTKGYNKVSDDDVVSPSTSDYVPSFSMDEKRVHECSICHKTFSKGQALGGHMRKHYEGVIGETGAKKQVFCDGKATSRAVAPLNFYDGKAAILAAVPLSFCNGKAASPAAVPLDICNGMAASQAAVPLDFCDGKVASRTAVPLDFDLNLLPAEYYEQVD